LSVHRIIPRPAFSHKLKFHQGFGILPQRTLRLAEFPMRLDRRIIGSKRLTQVIRCLGRLVHREQDLTHSKIGERMAWIQTQLSCHFRFGSFEIALPPVYVPDEVVKSGYAGIPGQRGAIRGKRLVEISARLERAAHKLVCLGGIRRKVFQTGRPFACQFA
jgi:hypothetical protein